MFGDLFSGGSDDEDTGRRVLAQQDFDESERIARKLTAPNAAELELLKKLGISADQADAAMLEEIRKLGLRGEDLADVDEAYMERAYQPAFERLMRDYRDLDQSVIENMNRRGIASLPGAESEPESYARNLLARDTKDTLARTKLEAQNQAVQQKLAQYNARLAEPNMAAVRFGQTATPYQQLVGVPESERMATRANAAGNVYSSKLGYASNLNNLRTQRHMQDQQSVMDLIGSGMSAGGSLIGMSDEKLKTDVSAADPEQDLAEISEMPVDRWKYRWDSPEQEMRTGPMAQNAPEDMQAEGGIDMISYMGKLANSIKALNNKVSAYDRLFQGGAA